MPELALIIEDDPKLADIFTQVVRLSGYQVTSIQDGQQAMDEIQSLTPTLVILDMHLPHRSGEEILQAIRAESRLTNTRIIVATADLFKAKELEAVVDYVMLKPVGFHKLYEVVSTLQGPIKNN